MARSKMARAESESVGAALRTDALEEELTLVVQAFDAVAAQPDDCRAVLAEFWEEADEALIRLLAQPAGPEESEQSPLRAPKAVAVLPGADAEARAAIRELTARPGWSLPWPLDQEGSLSGRVAASTPTPCRSTTASSRNSAASPPAPPLPTGRAEREAKRCAEETRPGVPTGNSFRSASQLLPPRPPTNDEQATPGAARGEAPGARGSAATSGPDFDAVSRSIVGRRSAGCSTAGRGSGHAGSGDAEAEREWSEEWLRIAEPDQLSRIVPALEATIQRAGARDAPKRGDIAGLEFVKTQIEEVLILPRLHPELFSSALTRPSRGLLLFGPPGTGKTMLARWIAAECGATFFNINASSVLSKWIGEAEKTVKALFQLAADRQPSVIFVDEIDSLLSRRRDADNESSRRVKNEFLTSLEGADTAAEDKILLVGATNMPWELDPAALRRLNKRLYVPLPGHKARAALLRRQLGAHNAAQGLGGAMQAPDLERIVEKTEDFSGSDLQALLREAAMGPVRDAQKAIGARNPRKRGAGALGSASGAVVAGSIAPRDIAVHDFECALRRVKPSFRPEEAIRHREFNDEHGTCRGEDAMHDADSDDGVGGGGAVDMDEEEVRSDVIDCE